MASSLAQQLKQVQSLNAAQLGNAREASKVLSASYLFPPNVASSQDSQTLQALGANGWEELVDSDATFNRWDSATGSGDFLFGSSSRVYDRLMKTKEENEQLDRAIKEFLQLVGGTLLDRSTGKCLEWLVRRFRIHQYNVEMVLAAFMPYHETQEFARMLQLLDLKDKPTFAFLLPVQKQAVTLPSSILLSSILAMPSTPASLSLFRWVINLLSPKSITRFRRPNHILHSFWFSIVIKICDRFRSNEIGKKKNLSYTEKEDLEHAYLSILLPPCLDAAITTQIGLDCQMGGCVALAMIATSFPLSNEAKESIMQSLTQAKMEGTRLQKASQTTIKLLSPREEVEEDEDVSKSPTLPAAGENPSALVEVPVVSERARKIKEGYDALQQMMDVQSEEAAYQIVNRFGVILAERLNDWTSGEITLHSGADKLSAEVQKELRRALEKKPDSRKTATKIEANLISMMATKVDPSRYSAIISMTEKSNLAALVYTLAISASFVNSSISSSIITTLFTRLGDASLTFLASIWTTSTNPVETRYAALHHAQSYLAAFNQTGATKRHVDFQAVIPSLLVALKDSQAFIRSSALLCLEHIANANASIEKEGKAGIKVEVYRYDTIYGQPQSDAVRYLDTSDSLRFLRSLLKAKESFHHDAAYLNSWLQNNVNVIRGESKRESSYKSKILEVLLSHIVSSASLDVKIDLLDALTEVHDANKLQMMLPLLKQAISIHEREGTEVETQQGEDLLSLLFAIYNASAVEIIEADAHDSWSFLMALLDKSSTFVLRNVAIRLQKSIFSRLSEDKRIKVYAKLVDVIANAAHPLPKELLSCLTSLDIATESLVPILSEKRTFVTSQALNLGTQHKKAKMQAVVSDESAWSTSLSVIVEILEARLAHKTGMASVAYILECLEILRLGTELVLSRYSRGEYLMQISMSNLSQSIDQVNAMQDDRLKGEITTTLRVDTVVSVIKTPCRPQTFQQALLLLSKLGKLAPEVVLHNAMPIFTFVGSTMLQRDDDYSFIVIEKTLQSILPAVVGDISTKHQMLVDQLTWLQGIRPFLVVFTNASKHIPRHRRLPFFNILIRILGPVYLAPICMLLTDRLATKVFKQSESDVSGLETIMQLPLSLFSNASQLVSNVEARQMLTCLNMIWDEVKRCWSQRNLTPAEHQDRIFLDCTPLSNGAEHDSRQTRPIRRIVALICFIYLATMSKADELEDSLRETDENGSHAQSEGETSLWQYIEFALEMTQVEEVTVKRTAMRALEEIMKIAPTRVLFNVTANLIGGNSIAERQRGLQLCTTRIERMSDEDRVKAATFTPKIIQDCYALIQEGKELAIPALQVLKAISENCVPSEHVALSAGLPIFIEESSKGMMESMQLLVTLSKHLGPRLIPHLKSILMMTTAILISVTFDKTAITCSLELLSSLIKAVPVFMTSHLEDIIKIFIQLPNIQNNPQASSLFSSVVRFIAPTQLLTCLMSIWQGGNKSFHSLHSTCLNLMERMIKSSDRKSIMTSYKTIFRYLLDILDARRHCQKKDDDQRWNLSSEEMIQTEDKAGLVLLRLILKLNENAFKPLFLRFCDWALLDLAEDEESKNREDSDGGILARKVVLYKVLNTLMTELGELISGYYLNILDATVDTLQEYAQGNIDLQQNDELWKQMIISLQKSAKADRDRGTFWNENRCKAIMPGLVSQIASIGIKSSMITSRNPNEQLLGHTIAALCRTVADESTLKLTSNLLLEQTRSNQVKIKISSLQILEKVWKSKECEDALLRLVPETVPSIAELLQESDAIIQEPLSGFVAAVENVLGENLDGYLQ